jgi:hypothetical protein
MFLNPEYAPRAAARMAQMIRAGGFNNKEAGPLAAQSGQAFLVCVPPVRVGGELSRCGPDELPCVLVSGSCLFDLYLRACFPTVEPIMLPAMPGVCCCLVCDSLKTGRLTFLDIGVCSDGRVKFLI